MAIIVGFVPGPQGQAALTAAIAEARRRERRLIVVNTTTGAGSADNRYADDADLAALTAELDRSGVDHEVMHSVERRDPAEILVDLARQTNADLIVIGIRRRTPVGKLILGSQAQRILLDAECPVLAVKSVD